MVFARGGNKTSTPTVLEEGDISDHYPVVGKTKGRSEANQDEGTRATESAPLYVDDFCPGDT